MVVAAPFEQVISPAVERVPVNAGEATGASNAKLLSVSVLAY
jgi:hypothetical protein